MNRIDVDKAVNILLKQARSLWKRAGRRGAFWVPTHNYVLKAGASRIPIQKDHGVAYWLCHMRKGVMHDNFPLGPEQEADLKL